jgi:site-specific DNA recombinase
MPRRAAIYVRISSDPGGLRLGVQRQITECRAKAKAHGWEVGRVFEDNDVSASGAKPRPAYRELLAALEAGTFDAVVVWDLDRLTRRPIEVEEFIELADRRKVALASVGGDVDLSTDNGRMFARIKEAVARAEVERKGARQRAANDQRAASGLSSAGRRAYGYTADGMNVVQGEADHLQRAASMLLEGHSLKAAVRAVNEAGARTTAGNPWSPTQLRRTLQNPRYIAQRVHRGEVVGPGSWPAIFDDSTHAALVALMADPTRHAAGPPRRYLLSGVARCGVCDGKVFGVGEKTKGPLYRCESRLHINRRAADVEAFVTDVIIARLSRSDAVELLTPPGDAEEAGPLREQQEQIRQRLLDVAGAFAAGSVTLPQMTAATASLRTRLEEVEGGLSSLTRAPVLADLLHADDVRAVWDDLPRDRQRAVIFTLAAVRLHPPGRGARTFDPASVEITWRAS